MVNLIGILILLGIEALGIISIIVYYREKINGLDSMLGHYVDLLSKEKVKVKQRNIEIEDLRNTISKANEELEDMKKSYRRKIQVIKEKINEEITKKDIC